MESQPQPETIGSNEVAEKQDRSKGETKSLAMMFKPKTGSWSCPGCYCQNESEHMRCPACNTIKPGAEDEVKKTETAKSPAGISSSGFKIGPGGFQLGEAATVGGGGFSFGKKMDGGGFSFGTPSTGGSLFSPKPPQQLPAATKDAASTSKVPVSEAPKSLSKSLAEVFKPEEGSWKCSGCYCLNSATQLKCPACETLKPGTKPEDIKSEAESSKPKGFLDGAGFKLTESSGFLFTSKPATPASPATENQKSKSSGTSGSLLAEMLQAKDTPEKTTAPATASSFSFTKPVVTFPPIADVSKKEGSGGFDFGTPTGLSKKNGATGFNFGKADDTTKKENTGFQFNLGKVSTPVKVKDGEKAEGSSPFQFTFSLTPSKSPQAKTATSPRSPDEGDYYVNKDDEDSHIYFEPIVSLPEKVDMKTGEEEEIIHFEQRAKLFRFHDNEWKERGLGTMKILEHKVSHRRRLLMRREQIFKVCCNHYITPELELKPMTKGDGKAWVWFAQDFAEEEAKMENLAIKFKTKEIAEQFKKEFDAAKQTTPFNTEGAESGAAAGQNEDLSDVEFLFKEEATEEQKTRAKKYQLPENFYLYENKPPCPGCIGCEDFDPNKPFTPRKQNSKGKSETSSPDPRPSGAQAPSNETTSASGKFSLFQQSTGPSFSTLAAQGDASGFAFKKDESRPFHWSGAGRPLFGSSSPGGQKTDCDDEVLPSEDIDFKPIIDLPDLIEVKTGEEDWEVVYCQRSKLYRFVQNQWKERAVGEMKILKQDNKYRLVMRRDQVHKVACNHLIDPKMKLEPMSTSETAWCWMAQDYSENEAKVEKFALRFKTEELAKQFKHKFEECQEHLRQVESDPKNSSQPAGPTVAQQLEEAATEEQVVEEEEEEEEDVDDSDEESIVIFEKRATLSCLENKEWKKLGMGNLKILYNEDLNGNNIEMQTDDGTKICNHVICREHTISLEKKVCMWSPIDFSTDEPVRRNFKAAFSSVAAAEEFAKSFLEGVKLAQDSELSEKISHEMDTPVVFSRGDATSLQDQKR